MIPKWTGYPCKSKSDSWLNQTGVFKYGEDGTWRNLPDEQQQQPWDRATRTFCARLERIDNLPSGFKQGTSRYQTQSSRVAPYFRFIPGTSSSSNPEVLKVPWKENAHTGKSDIASRLGLSVDSQDDFRRDHHRSRSDFVVLNWQRSVCRKQSTMTWWVKRNNGKLRTLVNLTLLVIFSKWPFWLGQCIFL